MLQKEAANRPPTVNLKSQVGYPTHVQEPPLKVATKPHTETHPYKYIDPHPLRHTPAYDLRPSLPTVGGCRRFAGATD